jgi:hypothetical protein
MRRSEEMSIAFIVYLASISDGIRAVAFTVSFFTGCGGLFAMMFYFAEKKGLKRVWISLLAATVALCCFGVVVPAGQDIYKIAGVTDQQKASIDASGKVLEVKK